MNTLNFYKFFNKGRNGLVKGGFLFFLFINFFAESMAQTDPPVSGGDAFIEKVTKMMDASNNTEAKQAAQSLKQAWEGGSLTAGQKTSIQRLSEKMITKNYKAYPNLSDFYLSVIKGTNAQLSSGQMDNMIMVAEKLLESSDRNNIQHYFSFLKNFFDHQALYYSSYSSLLFKNGTFNFDYIAPEGAELQEVVESSEKNPSETAPSEEWFSDWDDSNAGGDWSSADWETAEEYEVPAEDAAPAEPEPYAPIIDLPFVSGPVVRFEGIDLMFVTKFDSALLLGTNGDLMLLNNTFVGEGGKFTWTSAGLSPDSVYATFSKFKVATDKPEMSAEGVKLTYLGKVDGAVEGVFDYKNSRRDNPDEVRYPRFKSYENNIRVKNLGKNLFYNGGFSLMGNKIFSSSVVDGNAVIEVKEQNQTKFRAISNQFNLQDSLITADRAAVTIYHKTDSVFHPALKVKYNSSASLLTLLKESGGFKDTPFFSSYFKMEMNADMIKWDLNADSLDISILNAKSDIPAIFESQEYFKEKSFNQLAGLYNFNPLLMAVGYARKINSSAFYSDDMAAALKQNPATIKGAMSFLMQKGFINYDVNSGYVKIKRKGFHYVMSNQKLKDFDNLLIPSVSPSKPNATLDMKEEKLTVRGVDRFYISELLDVFIIPENREITLLGNRDFEFDGQVNAGNFEYIGKNFRFDYDSFLIQLPQIDSLKFNIETVETSKNNKSQKVKLSNQLRETAGVLYINKPNNKSAVKYYAQYPIFNSDKAAIVYFDNKKVLNGAYDKSVYFSIPAFQIDSVSSSDPTVIGFDGTFVSGGIFPEFRERLQVMPDNSLGFAHGLPYEGYELYKGKGTVYNEITLNSKGLRTSGKIDYLTSTLESEDFVYYIDSVLTKGTTAEIREGVLAKASFPEAKVGAYKMRWLPYQDSMYVSNVDAPFALYNETASLQGTAILSANGLFGSGVLLTRGSQATSDSLFFTKDNFTARHANFEIKSSNPQKPAFAGNDVRLNFNLVKGIADISPEIEGVAALEFPYAQFRTSITNASWNLEDKTVKMSKPDDIDISKSYFYTTRKELDKLAFNATDAIYDINTLQLNVFGIPYIKVADAKITPENNELLILENAVFDKFNNTTLVLDTLNEYHSLIKGDIEIISRNKFEGDATYQYINSISDTFNIKMGSFALIEDPNSRKKDTKYHTVASGTVEETDNLTLAPGLLYKGKMTMYADKPALELDGYIRLELNNMADNSWIVYKSSSDDEMGVINIAESVTDMGEPIAAGLFIDSQDKEIYATLLSSKRSPEDLPFFNTNGFLSYDPTKDEYKVFDKKNVEGAYSGRLFTYNEETTDVRAEGNLNFLDPNGGFKLAAAGLGKGNLNKKEFYFDTFLSYDFDIPSQAADMMGLEIADMVGRLGAPEAEKDRSALLYKLTSLIGAQAAKDYEQQSLSAYTPLPAAHGSLVKPLVFSSVNFAWSSERNSWYSSGKLGLSNILKNDVNAALDGFMEIRRTENGDEVSIFIQPSPSTWYFLSYVNNRLLIASPNREFNDIISSKSKAGKAGIGEYAFYKGEIVDALTFVNRFRKDYFDIDEPYQLNLPSENVIAEDETFDTVEEVEEDQDDFLFKEKVEEPTDSDGF